MFFNSLSGPRSKSTAALPQSGGAAFAAERRLNARKRMGSGLFASAISRVCRALALMPPRQKICSLAGQLTIVPKKQLMRAVIGR